MDDANVGRMFRLDGKVALVTGGARDLGYDMAVALAEAGADVIVTSRTLASARESAEKIRVAGGADAMALELDHCDWGQVASVVGKAHDWQGRLDVLINNAGGRVGTEGNLFKRPVEDIVTLIHRNLIGPLYCCKAAGPYMIKRGAGKIINIASIAGLIGRDRRMYDRNGLGQQPIDYAAAKAGVLGMTRDLAGLMSPHGICVNAISPGGFDKGLLPEGFVADYSDSTMQGRMGRMACDLKGAAVFLASSASDYVTGANLVVDGGFAVWK